MELQLRKGEWDDALSIARQAVASPGRSLVWKQQPIKVSKGLVNVAGRLTAETVGFVVGFGGIVRD